nr:glycosyltransferase [Arthrobacter caoxuetaonis]
MLKGAYALLDREFVLARRQADPVYHAEHGRILYCAHSVAPYNSNGYSTRTAGLVEGMTAAGIDVVVAARPGYPWDVKTDIDPTSDVSFEETIGGVSHFFSKGPSWSTDRLDHYLEQAVDSYVQVAIKTRAAKIQAASNHVTALPALIAARRLGIPFVYEVRGLWEVTRASTSPHWAESEAFELARKLESLVATEADGVFAITSQVRDELINRGAAPDKVQVLSNAVNTTSFAPMPPHEATRRNLGLQAGVPVIGYAGSLVAYEGLDTLLEAAKILVDEGRQFYIVIVGDGLEMSALKDKTQRLKLTEVVKFTGRVNPQEVADFISIFDVLPCPRLPLEITQLVSPLKPLEAMAAGKAVLLSDLPPLRDIAGGDGERARLFRAGDIKDLAHVLGELLDDSDARRAMGRRARLWTVRERNWTQIGAVAKETLVSLKPTVRPEALANTNQLSQMKIGIIADQFTTTGLEPEAQIVSLLPGQWHKTIEESRLDALFVESAWEGPGGVWKGKVGFYDEQSFSELRELVSFCRSRSIPTIFWNKEDPVHFNRFRETAQLFDYVFTSDDKSIPNYLKDAGPHLKSVSSLPFYAQPALHNPLSGSMPYEHTVAYAGSYYGARYPERSAQLQKLLAAAIPSGLSIYDRQHLNPESPYKFPPKLAPYVKGGLTYLETIDVYKSHPVHVNVNSVLNSGTMFSRRVYEIAACGGVVISGPSLGVQRMFGDIIPVAEDERSASYLISHWMNNECARKDEAWLAMRSVFRSHTAGHRLAYVLRTAGLMVSAPKLPDYAVVANRLTKDEVTQLESQSVRPAFVAVKEAYTTSLTSLEIRVASDPEAEVEASGIPFLGRIPANGIDRTFYEDLLTSLKYSDWSDAGYSHAAVLNESHSLATLNIRGSISYEDAGLHRVDRGVDRPSLRLSRTVRAPEPPITGSRITRVPHQQKKKTVLVAGHDLKFAQGIIKHLNACGHRVLIDQWNGHSGHDEGRSRELLDQADVIFCEWTLGNAVWYSANKRAGQRLVTRLHLQEISTNYLKKINTEAIDQFIFVGQHIASIARRDFEIPSEKSVVIPNYVPVDLLHLPKSDDARWNLGLVGVVPQRKRLDLALDALRLLRLKDERYRLYVKGKVAEDFPWMKDRPDELAYFQEQQRRIDEDPLLAGAVAFDGYGDEMAEWYRKIGTVLSVSDYESFHLTLADGAASGAVPASLAWDGVDQIYPAHWISATVTQMVESIAAQTKEPGDWQAAGDAAADYARHTFHEDLVLPKLGDWIVGGL